MMKVTSIYLNKSRHRFFSAHKLTIMMIFLFIMNVTACERSDKRGDLPVSVVSTGQNTSSKCETVSDEKRIRFWEPDALSFDMCKSQVQTRVCNEGQYTRWSGSYQFKACNGLSELSISSFSYVGGFRLSSDVFGGSQRATLNSSPGVIAFNPKNNSLFVVGHAKEQGIAEFAIPKVVDSKNIADFVIGEKVLQYFTPFHNTSRVDTGIKKYFRVTGLALIKDKLVVNYINWYDAKGNEKDTSVVFNNASNLSESNITGPFQLKGAAHASGWLTRIPGYWRDKLGGSHLSGYSGGSIISRLSVGPSAFVLSPESDLLKATTGKSIHTEALLDFNLKNMLYDKAVYGESYKNAKNILYNKNLKNNLWTIVSGASYGFIVPETNTYVTFGYSGGHESGLGYKITQDNGYLCPGPCPYEADDIYNYIWLWHATDLLKVKQGLLEPYEVRPYQYGRFDTPSKARITGGAYDEKNNLVYLSLRRGDTLGKYKRRPLFLAYKIKN